MKLKNVDGWVISLLGILAHLSLIPMILYATWHDYIIGFFIYFIMACLGITMTYHRYLSHRSWKCPKWFEIFGTLCASYSLAGTSLGWVAVHREHHRFVDSDRDPHGPSSKGILSVHYLSQFHQPSVIYIRDLLRSKFHLLIHKYYKYVHLMIISLFLLFYPWGLIYLYLFPNFLIWNLSGLVNTAGHLIGYRRYDTKDNSRNNPILGYLVFGEGWHNNHHYQPASWSFSRNIFELDIGGILIKLLDPTVKRPL